MSRDGIWQTSKMGICGYLLLLLPPLLLLASEMGTCVSYPFGDEYDREIISKLVLELSYNIR